MAERQIKSRERVAGRGEMFTAEREGRNTRLGVTLGLAPAILRKNRVFNEEGNLC